MPDVDDLSRENERLRSELESTKHRLAQLAGELQQTNDDLRAANDRLASTDLGKASFFSMVSHELRHPLTVAKGYIELATGGSGELDPETRGFLAIAEQNLRNLAQMVDDLLDFSRLEAGRYHVDKQAEQPSTLIHHAVLALAAEANAKRIELISEQPPGLPLVSADPLRIAQVLSNLVGNALKFTMGGGSIKVTACENGSEVEFVVADTGIGIEADELEKIFDEFYQAKNAKMARTEGAGLGLAISRQIVRLHSGRMWATSQVGVGTQLHFTLPRVPDLDPAAAAA